MNKISKFAVLVCLFSCLCNLYASASQLAKESSAAQGTLMQQHPKVPLAKVDDSTLSLEIIDFIPDSPGAKANTEVTRIASKMLPLTSTFDPSLFDDSDSDMMRGIPPQSGNMREAYIDDDVENRIFNQLNQKTHLTPQHKSVKATGQTAWWARESTSQTRAITALAKNWINLRPPLKYGFVSSPFGFRWGRMHMGTDFAAPMGSPILASAAGKVVFAGWESGYGNFVVIEHGFGVKTRYGHCSKLWVAAGQTVNAGQVIAQVGNTGHSTGPHLHFEVFTDGVAKNPEQFINN